MTTHSELQKEVAYGSSNYEGKKEITEPREELCLRKETGCAQGATKTRLDFSYTYTGWAKSNSLLEDFIKKKKALTQERNCASGRKLAVSKVLPKLDQTPLVLLVDDPNQIVIIEKKIVSVILDCQHKAPIKQSKN